MLYTLLTFLMYNGFVYIPGLLLASRAQPVLHLVRLSEWTKEDSQKSRANQGDPSSTLPTALSRD